MPNTPINTILSWFETGDFPTQEQFAASSDFLWHKDESIPMDSVENLAAELQKKNRQIGIRNTPDQSKRP